MAKIYIDSKEYEVDPHKNLLDICISLGLDLPYFCWHPALGSVGACRQCAVKMFKDENDSRGKLTMACMEPAADGTRISIKDPEAHEFRANVIEWLMVNHPHDCPICDEGGECHLQDMTVMTGHNYRRYRFNKRTYRNQYLGPFINHEMNRCIQCYRCVRFYRDYAGGRDLHALAAHNHVYFGRHEDGVLENEFSGNLVEVCPTGVFTDKTLKQHYARKWDLQTAPSICHHCGLGCNTIPGQRYDKLVRILSRYNGKVNGYFICDRGRFGYEFVHHTKRVRFILGRDKAGEQPEVVSKQAALNHVAGLISDQSKLIGIGSPRASLESNYALQKMVGAERFYSGMSEKEHRLVSTIVEILKNGPARTPSLKETEKADTVFVLGEDLTNTAPMLALALRQSVRQQPMEIPDQLNIPRWHDAAVREAIQEKKGPLFIATTVKTKLDDVATQTFRAAPQDLTRLGFAVAHLLNNQAPEVSDLADELYLFAQKIANALKEAQNPLIISGTSLGSELIIQAAANVAWALCTEEKRANLCYTVPECNSIGQALIGGKNLTAAIETFKNGKAETLIVLENDLYRRADKPVIDNLLKTVKHLVVFDYLDHATAAMAEAVIPVGTFAEADGTVVNNEGRAQRFYQVMMPDVDVQEGWRWLQEVMATAGRKDVQTWDSLLAVTQELEKELPLFKDISTLAPPPDFRIAGQKIPRQPHRFSGRTAMKAHINVSEPKPPDDPDSPLSFSMEGYRGKPPSSLIPFFWSPGWNSVQAINKYQIEVSGPLHGGDPGLRLMEPAENVDINFFKEIPQPHRIANGEWLLIPNHHIFGTEELSALAPAIAERTPEPFVILNPDDASQLNIAEGETVEIFTNTHSYKLPAKLQPELASGLAGFPVGLPELPWTESPVKCKIAGARR